MGEYKINVKKIQSLPEAVFVVRILGDSDTEHRVNLSEEYYKKLTNEKITPAELIRKSFEFLLERESNASILREFPLEKISEYFSEYEKEISV
ncbi:hypothetical protein ACFL3E_01865 [Patescibacteria group bacterium]